MNIDKRIDWKRNNKIALRNFSENQNFHDLCKCLLVRILRKNYKTSDKYPIYTEHDPDNPNESYPDIWMRVGKDIYVWELQERILKAWKEEIIKKYEDVNLIIVPLKEVQETWFTRIINEFQVNKDLNPIRDLRIVLEDYAIGK